MATGILVVDDGELDDLCALLDEQGLAYERLRGGGVPDEVDAPLHLFASTPRRALLASGWPAGEPTRLCISAEDSSTLRDQLRRMGFDLLVRRPIHAFALRLILMHALYGGDERRDEPRVVIGRPIEVRVGTAVATMLLADLSTRGGRVLSPQALAVGRRVTLNIPSELACGEALALRAKVVRCKPAGDVFDVALSADEPAATHREQLESAVLQLRADAEKKARATEPAAATLPAAGPASDADRRKDRRVAFGGEVHSIGVVGQQPLLGRDLSMGGMRVDARKGLDIGDRLHLAIYAVPDGEPIEVRATVDRVDEHGDMALRFLEVPPAVATRLEAVVGDLPGIEALKDGETEGLGSVVSQILEREGIDD